MSINSLITESLVLSEAVRPKLVSKRDVRIGKDVLELLTEAMYVDPLSIYREYIQNATDALDEARQTGLSFDENERIEVQINLTERTVRIRDNGASIPRSEFVPRLLAVGFSNKRGKAFRGFRGIGRLAGLAYCQELIFRGRAETHEPITEILFNARKLRELLNSHTVVDDLEAAVSQIATVNQTLSGSWPARFFEVELRKVVRIKNDVLLNREVVRDYLSQVGPVPFRIDFEYAGRIEEFLLRHGVGKAVQIIIDGTISTQRPHQSTFALTPKINDHFSGIQFFEIPGMNGGLDAIGWLLDHGYLGALPKNLNIGGLRLRAGNIQIGDRDILAELFSEPRFNSWCVGELHVLNPKILPNGRRDDFEHSVHYLNLQSHVSKIAAEISRTCRSRSGTRNLLKVTTQNLQKIKSEIEIVRSLPHNFPFRGKYVNSLGTFLNKQKATIEKNLPDAAQRRVLVKQVLDLRQKLDRTATLRTNGGVLNRLAPNKKKAYMEVLSVIYEVTSNTSIAHDYVNKILRRLARER